MIAQFYNKFDELHEQSLTQALAKSPNKAMIKNEVKYRIPERWTKGFYRNDVVSMDILRGQSIPDERGNINRHQIISKRNEYESKREKSLVDQVSGHAPIQNPILHHSLSSKNVDYQSPRSVSSKMIANSMGEKRADGESPNKLHFGY